MLMTPQTQSEYGSRDVDSLTRDSRSVPDLNGETSGHVVVASLFSGITDKVIVSTDVSVSGGSDTEARKDEKGHIRTSSAKKPSFKSVCINKTFQASKGAPSSVSVKAPEKTASSASSTAGPPSASSTPKPRLVAKSGSSLRDSSKSASAQYGRPAPDGNAVWNKNRPIPPPDPKKLTDEELSKLGIHVANRLQPDDAKGQSMWADIDEDDDEEWAPEGAITWSDGTKTTIPHADESAKIPEPPVVPENKPTDKPRSPAPSTAPTAAKSSVVLPSGKGLILKGAQEKPTLVAKPPVPPAPVKNPWAQMPVIQKVSPMDVSGDQPQRALQTPASAFGPKGVTPPAAREIAADDFSRSPRRDNRELFNSHSGRYEPVADRRGISKTDVHRADMHPRQQPALLQRSNHLETQGPAEPSPAFQTAHSSGSCGRRRGSSNVSVGSGSLQRMGKPYEQGVPPPDLLNPRRGSLAGASDHPTSPSNVSPSDHHAGGLRGRGASTWQHRASLAFSHAAPQLSSSIETPVAPPTVGAAFDDVGYQKKLMKERSEEARRRRQEEEAKEEAAKQERLRKKMEALGPAPERKSEKKEATKETLPAVHSDQPSQQPQLDKEVKDTSTQPTTILPINPAVENTRDSSPNDAQPETQFQAKASAVPEQATAAESKHAHLWTPRAQNQPDRFSWVTGGQTSRNVWGPPSSDRSLGNGTFISAPEAPPAQSTQLRSGRSGGLGLGPGPGPIAPPSASPSATSHPLQPGPIGPPQRNGSRAQVQDDNAQKRNKWTAAVMVNDDEARLNSQKQQRELEQDLKARGLDYTDLADPINDGWTSTKEDGQGQRVRDAMQWVLRGNNAQNPTSWKVATGDVSQQQQDATQRLARSQCASQNGSAAPGAQRSRFFPPSRDTQQVASAAMEMARPHSPSPPPPDMFGHPAFDGDAAHPHVALPPMKPIVRLPPALSPAPAASQHTGPNSSAWSPSALHSHPSRPTSGTSAAVHTRPATGFWQDRIKNLLSDNSSIPSSVDSSSRTSLAQLTHHAAATVSLPAYATASIAVDDCSYTTKIMDEDCFEEQEMGSLPPVHLPTQIPDAAWEPAKPPPRQDRKLKEAVASSANPYTFESESRNYTILLPGALGKKTVPVSASSRSPSNTGSRRVRGVRFSSSYRGGNRNREASDPTSAPTSTFSRAGRGSGFRAARSEGRWGRGASTTRIHTQ